MPTRIAPQLARATPEPPARAGWVHEVKHDGHRIIAYLDLDRGRVRLETRAGNDATRRFSPIAELLAKLPVRSAILDGEIAVRDELGVTHISLLDKALRGRGRHLVFYAFDLLFLDGLDRRRCCLLNRKAELAEVLARPPERVLLSEHLTCDGRAPCSTRSATSEAKASCRSARTRHTLPVPRPHGSSASTRQLASSLSLVTPRRQGHRLASGGRTITFGAAAGRSRRVLESWRAQ